MDFPVITTPPLKMQVMPGWALGMRKRATVVLAESKSAVVGVVLDRKGKVICEIHSYVNEQKCVVVDVCGNVTERC